MTLKTALPHSFLPMHRTASVRRTLTAVALPAALAMLVTGCTKKPIDDATLTTNVQSALSADAVIGKQPVQVAVQGGIVTLTGNVSDDTAKQVAAQDAARVAGVKEVVDSMTVAGVAVAPTITEAAPAASSSSASPAPPPMPRPTTPAERAAIANHQPLPQPLPPALVASAPQQPLVKTVHVAAGRVIPIRITESLSSETTQPGTTFHGVVTHEVDADGMLAIPAGSAVTGTVTDAKDAGHYKGNSLLSLTLDSIRIRGERVHVVTDAYSVEGKGRGKNTAEKIGGGAAVGAILGGIFGGGKGAAIGAAAGGGGGAVVQGVTRGQQVSIPSETVLHFHTIDPIAVQTTEVPYPDQNPDAAPSEPTLQPR
ncbi:BON domain-containing protein [Bryocella elongata]|uniref:BON domain-containing protein n=1 Tax=Bryocella elongata TaxID=863522 RepID=A0A1H6BZG8_9BACT|nr:BON domain-containing protein [Bryocella elongata]SEG66109.1 BON domain-containing protein [Bryocella elongata]